MLEQYASENAIEVPVAQLEETLAEALEQHRRQGQEPGSEQKERLRRQIAGRLRVEGLIERIGKDVAEPSEQQVRDFYEENKGRFAVPEQVRVSHIVKHINWQCEQSRALETVTEAKTRLEKGEDFEQLVSKYSDCPDKGGDLGYITRGQMVEEFEDVVFNLGPGETSDVFRTRFGFHIAKVYERKSAAVLSFEQAQEQAAGVVKEQMAERALECFVDELKERARIEEI